MNTLDLKGRNAVVTGGAAGIGFAIAQRLTASGARVWNPAFDITPNQLITGIITEHGIFRAPYVESLAHAFERETALRS